MSRTKQMLKTSSNPNLSLHDFQQLHSCRRDLMDDINEKMLRMQQQPPQSLPLDSWGSNYGFDTMMDQAATPNDFLPNPSHNYLDFSNQQPFLVADFLKSGLTPLEITSSKQPSNTALDQSMWGMDFPLPPNNTSSLTSYNVDYFNLDASPQHHAPQEPQVVAPTDLNSMPTLPSSSQERSPPDPSPTLSSAQDQPPPQPQDGVKVPKKRGRKRKQLDAKAKVEERKKFLERNRVAANRCRERKKTYVSNLEQRQKEMVSRNQILRREVQRLSEEVAQLREMVAVKCECSEEKLEQNLREGLQNSMNDEGDVEAVVEKFTALRSGSLSGPGSLGESVGSPSEIESVVDSLFSAATDARGEGGTAQSSPVEFTEMEKAAYPPF